MLLVRFAQFDAFLLCLIVLPRIIQSLRKREGWLPCFSFNKVCGRCLLCYMVVTCPERPLYYFDFHLHSRSVYTINMNSLGLAFGGALS